MLKLSIIIPVYNVEKYVEKCLVSCARQDCSSASYEIIVVNDGTKDNSLAIAEEVACKYDNINITSQLNAGLSEARNKGLSLAKGEYVWFVDSDDWIDANCLANIMEQLNGIDVLAMGCRFIINDKPSSEYRVSDENAISGKMLLAKGIIRPAQFYVYKRSFLDEYGLRFMPCVYHEDFEFTPRMLYFADKLMVYRGIVYNYLIREGSIMQTVSPKRSFDYVKVVVALSVFMAAHVDKQFKPYFNNLISLALNNSLFNALKMNVRDRKLLSDVFYESRFLFPALINSSSVKYRMEGYLFSLFPRHCLGIYAILRLFKKKKNNQPITL
nr:glycosyltransferase [uncultured Bacteroides sp.]